MSNINLTFGPSGELTNFNFSTPSTGEKKYDFAFGEGTTTYLLLFGKSNNFNSIWADEKASLKNGTFYVGRTNDLTIINNNNGQACIKNYFSANTEETLNYENSVDINVI